MGIFEKMEKVVAFYKLGEEPDQGLEWLEKTPMERLEGLTQIRRRWISIKSKGTDGEGLQRVFRAITRARR